MGLGNPRLGQATTLTNRMAEAVVAQAEPRLRQVISEERNRWADAIMVGLPYAGISLATSLATTYFLPPGETAWKVGGYGVSLVTLLYGVWDAVDSLKEPTQPEPRDEKTGIVQDVISTFVDPASSQLAQDIVEKAMPRVEKIVEEESQRATDAAHAIIPWLGVTALAFLGTAYLVPATMPPAKMAGYGMAAASTLVGLYQGTEATR